MYSFAKTLSFAALCAVSCTFGACSATDSDPASSNAETPATGTLQLPLVTTAGGHQYQLVASFYVVGPVYSWYSSDDESEQLTISLPTGDYYLNLYSWQLYRIDTEGSRLPVVANLVSSTSQFTIYNGSTSSVSFQFETDGLLVTTGTGSVSVDVAVTEVAPPCTPLGDDCEQGYWCPPSELVSRSPSCLPAGTAPLGQDCRNLAECVANASCIDLGAGPRCVALCNSGDFDAQCDVGGTCTAQGVDYGACVVSEASADGGVESDASAP